MSDVKGAVSKLKDFEAKIIAKALEDDRFRQKLIGDPKGTLASEAGKDLPEGLVVKVQEEEANTLTIVLPKKPAEATAEDELSDEALEKAAGGGAIADFAVSALVSAI